MILRYQILGFEFEMVSEKIKTVRERERERERERVWNIQKAVWDKNFNQRTQCVRERVGWESSAVFI